MKHKKLESNNVAGGKHRKMCVSASWVGLGLTSDWLRKWHELFLHQTLSIVL